MPKVDPQQCNSTNIFKDIDCMIFSDLVNNWKLVSCILHLCRHDGHSPLQDSTPQSLETCDSCAALPLKPLGSAMPGSLKASVVYYTSKKQLKEVAMQKPKATRKWTSTQHGFKKSA